MEQLSVIYVCAAFFSYLFDIKYQNIRTDIQTSPTETFPQ